MVHVSSVGVREKKRLAGVGGVIERKSPAYQKLVPARIPR
jgi:hypothetical protein